MQSQGLPLLCMDDGPIMARLLSAMRAILIRTTCYFQMTSSGYIVLVRNFQVLRGALDKVKSTVTERFLLYFEAIIRPTVM